MTWPSKVCLGQDDQITGHNPICSKCDLIFKLEFVCLGLEVLYYFDPCEPNNFMGDFGSIHWIKPTKMGHDDPTISTWAGYLALFIFC